MSFSNRRFGNPAFLRQFFICTFFLLYLRAKEEKKYPQKRRKDAIVFYVFALLSRVFCSTSSNLLCSLLCYAHARIFKSLSIGGGLGWGLVFNRIQSPSKVRLSWIIASRSAVVHSICLRKLTFTLLRATSAFRFASAYAKSSELL